jgi:hypothetical protein
MAFLHLWEDARMPLIRLQLLTFHLLYNVSFIDHPGNSAV